MFFQSGNHAIANLITFLVVNCVDCGLFFGWMFGNFLFEYEGVHLPHFFQELHEI